jgi:hypothetical protein
MVLRLIRGGWRGRISMVGNRGPGGIAGGDLDSACGEGNEGDTGLVGQRRIPWAQVIKSMIVCIKWRRGG